LCGKMVFPFTAFFLEIMKRLWKVAFAI
jgi:hypothetical protein